jgi:TPR repeat protein
MTGENADDSGAGRIDALRAAAEAGDAAAQLELANRHHFGDGVGRDDSESYRWMRKAAEAGLPEAQSKVGYFLTEGLGVAPDPKGALKWFLRGLRGGYAKAGYNLGEAYRTGSHVTRSPRRAWLFFSKATELGQEAAHWGLAQLCLEGRGLPNDEAEALVHLGRAVRAGLPEAILETGRLYRAGVAGPADLAAAEARALAFHRRGDLASLHTLFELRREAAPAPAAPPGIDDVAAELDRRQATRREVAQPAAADVRHGIDLYWGHGVAQDVAGALALLESAAGAGNADAARFLGLAHDGYGGGVPKSPDVAMRWYEEAARLGDAHGCFVVGMTLLEREAGERESPEGQLGLELVERAAELGFPRACGYLGARLAREATGWDELVEEEAFPLLRLGAVRGDDDAARTLAGLLEEMGGRERLREAAYWHLVAARRDSRSARSLGLAYGQGLGVEQSDEAAAAWLARAAEDGNVEATAQLAACFMHGRGVPRDPLLVIRLAGHAADEGVGVGARILGELYNDGLGVPRDAELAAAWYRRGAELGDAISMTAFASALFDGRGVDPDAAAAVEWLRKATTRGPDGRHLLAVMLFRGEGTAPDPVEARSLFKLAAADGHLPSRFTTIEQEALRFRPAGTRPEGMKERIDEAAAELALLSAGAALDAGLLVWNGDVGLVCDDDLAARFFRAAAEKGNALAAACLSRVLRLAGDGDGEREWLDRAARLRADVTSG